MAKDKLPVIERQFTKAEKIIRKKEELEKLKKDSPFKNLCLGIIRYINNDHDAGCTAIYRVYSVSPQNMKDNRYTNYIKQRLRVIKNPLLAQTNLFATS